MTLEKPLDPTQTPSHHLSAREISQLAQSLQVKRIHLEKALELLAHGATIPFIARYRRAETAGMDDHALRTIKERLRKSKDFHDRRETILKSIETLGKLTDSLKSRILDCHNARDLEDQFLPFKPKKQAFADEARAKGLEAFSDAIWNSDQAVANLDEILASMVNPEKGLDSPDKVLEAVTRILAEKISEIPQVRASIREIIHKGRISTTKGPKAHDKQGIDFRDYFNYSEPIPNLQSRKFLNIDRGVKQGFLSFFFHWDKEAARKQALNALFATFACPTKQVEETPHAQEGAPVETPPSAPAHPHAQLLEKSLELAMDQLIVSALEKEAWKEFADRASEHASHILARFLNNRLMATPAGKIPVLAIVPGFRNGCSLAVLDGEGKLLGHDTIYPLQPQNKRELAFLKLEGMIRKHQVGKIALANGNATKPMEQFLYEFFDRLENPKDHTHASEPETAVSSPVEPPVEEPSKHEHAEQSPPETAPSPEITTTMEGAGQETPAEATTPAAPTEEDKAAQKKAEEDARRAADRLKRQEEYKKQIEETIESNKLLPPHPKEIAFSLVLEEGADTYASSGLGREELPDLETSLRATISIGRRLQNPLKEMVKVDPVHLVSGILPVDVPHRFLRPSLETVIESAMNCDGCDLNEADISTLKHISGLNQLLAVEIVQARTRIEKFSNRQQLLEVPGITPEKFTQCAGFLHIQNGTEAFDATNLHPETYPTAEKILAEFGISKDEWTGQQGKSNLLERARACNMAEVAEKLSLDSVATLRDFLDELIQPLRVGKGRSFGPVYRSKLLKTEELQPGMELIGVVQNIVEFGCFVDVGLKESGLVHISQISARYVRSPFESVSLGDIVKTWVIAVDKEKGRVSLTMIRPGSDQPSHPPRGERGQNRPRRQQEPRSLQTESRPAEQSRADHQETTNTPRQPSRTPIRSNSSSSFGRPKDNRPRAGQGGPRKTRDAERPPQIMTFKSSKPVPKPNLSESALSGTSPLGTFAELAVFWEKKDPAPSDSNKESPPPHTDGPSGS